MKKECIVLIVAHILAGVSLMLLSIFLKEDSHHYNLMIIAFFIFSILSLLACALDENNKLPMRIAYCVVGLTAMIFGLILIMAKDKISIIAACIMMGVLEIINSGVKTEEIIHRIRLKDWFGLLLMPSISAELVLGVILCIEKEPSIQLHLILIGVTLSYESVVLFAFEFIAKYREKRKE